MDGAQPTEGLNASYGRWRSSRPGQITHRLEQQLLFELVGPVAAKTLLDVGCGDGAINTLKNHRCARSKASDRHCLFVRAWAEDS